MPGFSAVRCYCGRLWSGKCRINSSELSRPRLDTADSDDPAPVSIANGIAPSKAMQYLGGRCINGYPPDTHAGSVSLGLIGRYGWRCTPKSPLSISGPAFHSLRDLRRLLLGSISYLYAVVPSEEEADIVLTSVYPPNQTRPYPKRRSLTSGRMCARITAIADIRFRTISTPMATGTAGFPGGTDIFPGQATSGRHRRSTARLFTGLSHWLTSTACTDRVRCQAPLTRSVLLFCCQFSGAPSVAGCRTACSRRTGRCFWKGCGKTLPSFEFSLLPRYPFDLFENSIFPRMVY